MNVKSLSDATLLAVWRALDSEVRKRKVKNTMPVGTFTVGWFYFRARSMEISEEP